MRRSFSSRRTAVPQPERAQICNIADHSVPGGSHPEKNPHVMDIFTKESRSATVNSNPFTPGGGAAVPDPERELVEDVMRCLEESEHFLSAQAAVQNRSRNKSAQRKVADKSTYVTDPKRSAQARISKNEREKKRRKLRVDERRQMRGGVAMKRHGMDDK
jgi:hypothetical protein